MKFNIDIYADNLMLPVDELKARNVSPQVISRLIRLRDIYNYILRNPLKKIGNISIIFKVTICRQTANR